MDADKEEEEGETVKDDGYTSLPTTMFLFIVPMTVTLPFPSRLEESEVAEEEVEAEDLEGIVRGGGHALLADAGTAQSVLCVPCALCVPYVL